MIEPGDVWLGLPQGPVILRASGNAERPLATTNYNGQTFMWSPQFLKECTLPYTFLKGSSLLRRLLEIT